MLTEAHKCSEVKPKTEDLATFGQPLERCHGTEGQ
jgi:hypothetical protein